MKTRNIYVKTFMSWVNKGNGDTVRAVALCDKDGYFDEAINCMRDGDMGEKDENGVYSRIWYGDYIHNGEVSNLHPATKEDIALYLKYCNYVYGVDERDYKVTVIHGYYQTDVIVEYKPSLWRRIKVFFKKNQLPF